MTKFIIILVITSMFIWSIAIIYLTAKIHYNYKYALQLKNNFEKWSEDPNRIDTRPTGHEVGKLFKKLYPNKPFPQGEAKFHDEPGYPDDFTINFIKDFPIYKSVEGISLNGIYNESDIEQEESKIIYGMYRDCKDSKKQIRNISFWICFIICFPSQLINTIYGTLIPKNTSSRKRINIINIIYWIYEIISIWFMLYKIIP